MFVDQKHELTESGFDLVIHGIDRGVVFEHDRVLREDVAARYADRVSPDLLNLEIVISASVLDVVDDAAF